MRYLISLVLIGSCYGQLNTVGFPTYNVAINTSGFNLQAGGTILNLTGSGFLGEVTCRSTLGASIPSNTPPGVNTVSISIDGKPATSFILYSGSTVATVTNWISTGAILNLKEVSSQTGANIGDGFKLVFNIPFQTSALISITGTGVAGTQGLYTCTSISGVKN